jgi:DnaJ-class molecular chaperone
VIFYSSERSYFNHFSLLVLSIAYETLSNPSSKLMYDVSKHKGTASASASFVSTDDDNPNDTLQRVLHQVCYIYYSEQDKILTLTK